MKVLFTTLSLLFISTSIHAQNADEILSKYFETVGGLEKLTSLRSLKMNGKVPTPQGDFFFSIYQKAPNSYKMEMDIQGYILIPQAYDGTIAWSLNPFESATAERLPEDQAEVVADQAEFQDEFINYRKKGHAVTLEGKEQIDGVVCFKLKLVKNQNNDKQNLIEYHFFDAEYYIPIMVRSISRIGPQKGQEVETYLSDYQEVENGLIMPFYIETKTNGEVGQQITITEIEFDLGLEDDIFRYEGQ